jgi:hypothetical protein
VAEIDKYELDRLLENRYARVARPTPNGVILVGLARFELRSPWTPDRGLVGR